MVARCLSKNFFGYAVNLYRCLVQTRLKDGLTLTTATAKASIFLLRANQKQIAYPTGDTFFDCSKKVSNLKPELTSRLSRNLIRRRKI